MRLNSSCWLIMAVLLTASSPAAGAEDVYQEPEVFIAESFDGEPPPPAVLWLTKPVRAQIKAILGHEYNGLRIRYWQHGDRTAWVLDEIGKVEPITTGIVVADGTIQRLKVLVYRETHGWEVKHPFFSERFHGVGLDEKGGLDQPIDNIAGATLSVNALKRLGALALYLDAQTRIGDDP